MSLRVARNITDSIQEEQRRSMILAVDIDEQNCQNEKEKKEELQVCLTFLFIESIINSICRPLRKNGSKL